MKAYAIVLACGAMALAATSLVEFFSMWGPFVFMCLLMALLTVRVLTAENGEQPARVSLKKAA